MKIYIELFTSFFKPGVSTFGGGPSAIPIIQQEVVEKRLWLTQNEFIDALAFGNSLPGPIATKLSALIGYKVGGALGAFVAIFAIVAPTALAMILLLNVYTKYKDTPWMAGMLTLVKPVVFILILDICVGMRGVFKGSIPFIVAIVSAIGLYVFKLNPAILILSSLIGGGLFMR